jgi:hypothetical protein
MVGARCRVLCLEPCGARRFDDARVLKKTGYQDRSNINMHEPHEVQCWTKPLGVSKEELQKAVCGEARNDSSGNTLVLGCQILPQMAGKSDGPSFSALLGPFLCAEPARDS